MLNLQPVLLHTQGPPRRGVELLTCELSRKHSAMAFGRIAALT